MKNSIFEKAQDLREATREGTENLSRRASNLAASVEETKGKIGERMKTAAGKIRETEPRIEQAVHNAAETIADKLEKGGTYLAEGRLGGNVTSLIRRYPVPSLLVGMALGLALGAKLRR